MSDETLIRRGTPQYEAAQKLLDTALDYWKTCDSGAVRWLSGVNGELIIFTRMEYRATLMHNIPCLESVHKVDVFERQDMEHEDEGEET